jgi:glycosyltransferase involved in cell wall biosynthesis
MLTALALLAQRQRRFVPRLASERKAMRLANHIMGRTLWDMAQAKALVPDASYYHCPRILRDDFYARRWNPGAADSFSIFMGNGASPRKGAHIAVHALSFLAKDFPQAELFIAGEDPRSLPWRSAKRHVGYPVYLLHLIRKLGLEDRVHFTGVLSDHEMAERMKRSHVCLMASLIENSPNTLAEAMILGVPTISAYAGGAPSMARDEKEVLFYRADDPAMLALQVRRLFTDSVLAERLSRAARARALITHDPQRNLADLLAVYNTILAESGDSSQ